MPHLPFLIGVVMISSVCRFRICYQRAAVQVSYSRYAVRCWNRKDRLSHMGRSKNLTPNNDRATMSPCSRHVVTSTLHTDLDRNSGGAGCQCQPGLVCLSASKSLHRYKVTRRISGWYLETGVSRICTLHGASKRLCT